MRIKKFFAILIVVALLLTLSLASCEPSNSNDNNDDDVNEEKKPDVVEDDLGPDATLSDLYAWIDDLALEDIVKVYCEKGGIAVAPGSPVYYAYSTDSTDIANTFELLSCKLTAISRSEGQLDGGSYIRYTFYTTSGEMYSINISNYIVVINGYYYKVESFNYTFQYPYSSSDKSAPVEDNCDDNNLT